YGSGGYGNIGVVGGAGGGKIKIVARNNLILSSSAVISADGYDSTTSSTSKGGGGAGGSILLDVGEILSNGSGISASGGKGSQVSGPTYYGGGGGGGCVRAFGKNTSAFTFGVSGGSGTSPGGAGSVFHSDLLTTGEFRKVFVTSGFYGLKAGRASLDTACSTEAASAGLYSSVSGVSWKALVSESASHATTLLSAHKVNNVRGEQVSYISSFFSSLVNPIQYYASGELAAAGSDVITGSNTTGAYDSTGSCVNYSASGIFNYSNPSSISSSWFSLNSTSGSGCDGTARVYCISQ
ncbi:MAG: hypothetical protein NTV34_04270, partial [Proteobacteria bacterium]|nr:hypothetical protein [Pseudomonadota bacterium]